MPKQPTEQQLRAGERMKEAAAEKGLNAYDVAKQLGVRPPTVYRWFKGSRPDQEMLEAFAVLVERSVSDFWADADAAAVARQIVLRWAERLMAGATNAEAMHKAGMAHEDLTRAELLGLQMSEEQFRQSLLRASGGRWATLSETERAAVLTRLIDELEAENGTTEGSQTPAPPPSPPRKG